MSDWLDSAEAARRLRVKPETLYAYVSRGAIRSERDPGQRHSRYLRSDVDGLAAGKPASGGGSGGLEIIVESKLTLLDPAGKLYYRGWNAATAAETATFEEVAAWLCS